MRSHKLQCSALFALHHPRSHITQWVDTSRQGNSLNLDIHREAVCEAAAQWYNDVNDLIETFLVYIWRDPQLFPS